VQPFRVYIGAPECCELRLCAQPAATVGASDAVVTPQCKTGPKSPGENSRPTLVRGVGEGRDIISPERSKLPLQGL
jgi:hypothetical protein